MIIWVSALWIWGIGAVVMAAAWFFSMRARNVSYASVAWAGLMAMSALLAGLLSEGAALPRTLTAIGGAIWGARLCVHLLQRILHEDEDARYLALRTAWDHHRGRWFLFFQAQALTAGLLALPFLAAANRTSGEVDAWILAAIMVWIAAVGGESIADAQLAAFRADPDNRGSVCRNGLWAWSRHPNYFFEWLHWFSYVLLAAGSPYAWLSWLGPVLMLALLWRISGIRWIEQQALRSRGEPYRRYQREVSGFVPWPPRREPAA